ncbi:MAG: outer membrane lipoprotein-sorting protein [Spirochaetaceae bacterium]|nr:MAG: outer membrane lipoprotein-sorting protein [Spirochaetaceae bacterium]
MGKRITAEYRDNYKAGAGRATRSWIILLCVTGLLVAPGPPGGDSGTGDTGGTGGVAAQERPAASAPSGDEILRRMEETLFPDSYRMEMEMITLEASGRERTLELDVLYRRGTGSYMEILAPPRSRGTRFLQRDGSLWMFMPRGGARSAIRLAPRDSFQGSVFANSDIGESSYTDDYRGMDPRRERYRHPELGEVEVFIVEAVPRRPEAPYGRVVARVTVEGFIPLHMEYYVRSGLRIKEMELSQIREIAGRRRPTRMDMRALDEEGKVSTLWVRSLREETFPDRIFTQRHLTR